MSDLSIGASALQVAQQGLSVAGSNLANASTPGYHRQILHLAAVDPTQLGGLSIGNGVTVTDIQRAVSEQLDATLNAQTSINNFVDTSLTSSTQIEQAISTGTSSPTTQLDGLLNALQTLSSSPKSGAYQQAVVASATSVANAFNAAASDLSNIRNGLNQQVGDIVDQINSLTNQIADLNQKIANLSIKSGNGNTLLDQQSQLVNSLSQFVNVQVQTSPNGEITVNSSGISLVAGNTAFAVAASIDSTGNISVGSPGSPASLTNSSGQLGAVVNQFNSVVPDYVNRLNELAQKVSSAFDKIQATGLGTLGAFTQLNGQRAVNSTTATLNAAGLAFPPGVGSLYIGVTDTSTGQRTLTQVAIDPQNQSLNDVANAINVANPNVQAFVNNQTGTISLAAAPGYTFDFTGGAESSPTTNYSNGSTTTPTLGGVYKGTTNDSYTVTFQGNGTVGQTPNLQAQVTDSTGNVISTVNVGQGYVAGQPIKLANGVTVSLSAGTVAQNDSFSSPLIGNPDSSGLLTALGLNTLFTGNDAGSLKVNPDVISDPSRVATSRSGAPGDTSNLQRFVSLGTAAVLGNGTQTFNQYSNQMVSDIGTNVQSLTSQQSTNQVLMTNINNQQQSISGVNTDEELANVLKFQQMYQMAAKYISAVNNAVQSLITGINV